jgi:hypothetical protein
MYNLFEGVGGRQPLKKFTTFLQGLVVTNPSRNL